jgi:hypothetical protein
MDSVTVVFDGARGSFEKMRISSLFMLLSQLSYFIPTALSTYSIKFQFPKERQTSPDFSPETVERTATIKRTTPSTKEFTCINSHVHAPEHYVENEPGRTFKKKTSSLPPSDPE